MAAQKEKKPSNQKDDMLVVGLGASAGGLKPLKTFFSLLPEKTGMAFIVVIHLSPDHESNLAELLQEQTDLTVLQVKEQVQLKADHVYVIPPDKMLAVGDNHLELSEPETEHGLATVDHLFRSLAEVKGKNSVCIILSGSGSDGAVGLKAIKEHNGFAMVQKPEEAQYSAMPANAIKTGVVDKILPVEDITKELLDYSKNLSRINIPDNTDKLSEEERQTLSKILEKVRVKTGHDFSNYKRASVLRRLDRRMRVNRVSRLTDYYDYMNDNADEVKELLKDLLISVTNFFRDPEAFEALEEKVIPHLFDNKTLNDQVRIWVPGCATGEEAYSIAIQVHEHLQKLDAQPEVQIFATDIDDSALDVGRLGRYPSSIAGDVSTERIRRFFQKDGDEYQVKRKIRDMILFAPHDLLRDPPFSKLDLITSRNLLIYLNRDLQQDVFNLFHYALRSEGWLFLGLSDSNLEGQELFNVVDKKHSIYKQKPGSQSQHRLPDIPLRFNKTPTSQSVETPSQRKENYEKLHRNLLVRLYAPQSVLINDHYDVIHATDGINKFLQYSGGEPSRNVLEMVKTNMRQALRSILYKVQKEESGDVQEKMQVRIGDKEKDVEIIAYHIRKNELGDGLIHVVFREVQETDTARPTKKEKAEASDEETEIIETLEKELEYTKEQLHLSVEEYETSNEELRASNEELQSMNEELQSTTEELETSQEELQSVNEELQTVNQELEGKVEKLDRTNSDLKNLMEATEVGIIFVDDDYRVQRFTTPSADIFNLIDSDTGRPLAHVTHSLEYGDIMEDVKKVHENLEKIKKVVCTKDNRWYIMRLRPYRSVKNKIEGVVLTFVEFSELRDVKEQLSRQNRQEILAKLGVYALEQHDLKTLMQRAIKLSCITLDLDCAVMLSLNKEEGTFEMGTHSGCAKKNEPILSDEAFDVGYALQAGEPTVVRNYTDEERFSISPFVEHMDMASGVNIVIRGMDDTYGVLGFYTKEEREFSEMNINFIQSVANIVGMCIERDHNLQRLKETNAQLEEAMKQSRKYQKEIINNSLVERWELGSYLHDNLAQLLVSMKLMINDLGEKFRQMQSEAPAELAQMKEAIESGMSGIRDLTHDIIPVDIEEEGVNHAFRFLLRQCQKLHGVNCRLEADDVINDISDRKLATNLYHIVQEAIKNAVLHGKAKNITVSMKRSDGHLQLRIDDDGMGVSHSSPENHGRGLQIMKHRIELLDGTFDIGDGHAENGTQLIFTIPLKYVKGSTEEE